MCMCIAMTELQAGSGLSSILSHESLTEAGTCLQRSALGGTGDATVNAETLVSVYETC